MMSAIRFLSSCCNRVSVFFFFQAEDGIRDVAVTGVQTCALPIYTVEIRRLIDAALPSFAEQLGDATDPNRHAKYLVVADLTWRIWYLAMSIHILLEEEVYAPAVVLARALWEALATLGYLVKHPKFQDEAVILLAFSHKQLVKQFTHQTDLVKERNEILG